MRIWFYTPEKAATVVNSTYYPQQFLEGPPPLGPDDPPIVGIMRVSMEKYVWFLDLLRNESPVYAIFDTDDPSNNYIHTI